VFWQSALANFVGSVAAAGLLWFVVTRFYELPRSRKQTRELLSVSYAIVKFEMLFNELYCRELIEKPGQSPAGFPVTQGWETLHSTEAFRQLPPPIAGKLVLIYSLLFRLHGNIEFVHRLVLEEWRPLIGPNPYSKLRAEVSGFARQVAEKILTAQAAFARALQNEIDMLSDDEKRTFEQAFQLYQVGAKKEQTEGCS